MVVVVVMVVVGGGGGGGVGRAIVMPFNLLAVDCRAQYIYITD